MCILKRALGGEIAEEDLLARWEPHRLPAGTFGWAPAEEELGFEQRWWNPDEDDAITKLRLRIGPDGWALVWVLARYYTPWLAGRGLSSPHGSIATLHHAVVIADPGPPGLQLLDPFFASSGQPLQVTDEEALSFLSGHVLDVRRDGDGPSRSCTSSTSRS